MPALTLAPNLSGHDDIYEALMRMNEGLSDAASLKRWAKFGLILANHIGDRSVIEEAISLSSEERRSISQDRTSTRHIGSRQGAGTSHDGR